jgi:hypothetical protein
MSSSKDSQILTFSSQFDSGNMRNCGIGEEEGTYNLWISGDSLPYDPKGHYKTWFYFSVSGVDIGYEMKFSIRNMNNQGRLFKQGLRPVYRSASNMKWKRVLGKIDYKILPTGLSTLTWSHTFDNISNSDEAVYFAYTYPYSYSESLNKT